MADYYQTLGVSPDATPEQIKKAYRRLARELHPDAGPGDAASEAKFREVTEAYEVLSDPERRARFDQFGSDEPGMGDLFGGGGGLGDLFDAFFGGDPRGGGGRPGPVSGPDIQGAIVLDLEEAVFGGTQPLTVRTAVVCVTCEASGAQPGTYAERCTECQGSGQVRRTRQSILGQMVTAAPCPRCGGQGEMIASPCDDCGGDGRVIEEREFSIDIPPGVDDGSTLRLPGKGAAGVRGGPAGDLYVQIRVNPHERFQRRGDDLYEAVHVSMVEAALGAHRSYETLDGTEDLVIRPGTQTGTVLRLRRQGATVLQAGGRRGDLLVEIVVDTPIDLADEEQELLRQMAEIRGLEVAPPDEGFFSKIKSAFR